MGTGDWCPSGFGAETARQFAGMGMNLLLGARREEQLAEVAAECTGRGCRLCTRTSWT